MANVPLDTTALDRLFRDARTFSHFQDRPVPEPLLRELYALLCLGPTSANCQPGRYVFVTTPEAKVRLLAAMSSGNRDKTRLAPVTVLIAQDLDFPATLPQTFPHADARSWFTGQPALIAETALRNSSLQGAYLMLAARSLGLDCGPMSGFDAARIDAEFFAGSNVRVNFVCNLGFGDRSRLHLRLPRLSFEQTCRIV
jgi:3-hydroxypropanoate dehydrogenase